MARSSPVKPTWNSQGTRDRDGSAVWGNPAVSLRLDGRRARLVQTEVLHSVMTPYAGGLGVPVEVGGVVVQHYFDVVVAAAQLSVTDAATLRDVAPVLPAARQDDPTDSIAVVARACISEFPVRLVSDAGGWLQVLDAVDGDTSSLVDLVNGIVDSGGAYELALIGGSLFYVRSVEVHPCAQGEAVGLRLLRHIMARLPRSGGDVFALIASPIRNGLLGPTFPIGESSHSAHTDGAERLAQYYGQLGFVRWGVEQPDEPSLGEKADVSRRGILMFHLTGSVALPK